MHTVEPPFRTLMLLCSTCRGARRGPDARDIRKQLKRALGKSKALRITEVACLDLCPDGAVATCLVDCSARREPARCVLVDSEAQVDGLIDELTHRLNADVTA